MKDLEKHEMSTTDALLTDISRYERMIGELLERNETLSSQLEQTEQQRLAAIENQLSSHNAELGALQTAVMRLAAQQGKSFDLVMRLMAEMLISQTGSLSEKHAGPLAQALSLSESYSAAIEGILTGRTSEYLRQRRLEIAPSMACFPSRGTALFTEALDFRKRSAVVLCEDTSKGIHSLRLPIEGVSPVALRGVKLEILAREVGAVRIRLRNTNNPDNSLEVAVDLRTGHYANFKTKDMAGGRRNVTVQPNRDDWKSIEIQAGLLPTNDGGELELELIALDAREDTSSRREGSGKEAFALRGLLVLYSAGLTEVATPVTDDAGPSEGPPAPAADPTTVVQVQMPGQESRRAEARAAFLASGAYASLSTFRGRHRGKRAFILGNGPSINGQDLTLLKDEVTFVTNWFVNHPQYEQINPTYYCVSSHEMFGGWGTETPAANPDWLGRMQKKAGGAHKFFSYPFRDYILNHGVFPEGSCDFLLFDRPKYQVDQRRDINLDLTRHMDDGYTGIITFCLPLAHFMGIEEIYLLGCDCDYGEIKEGAPKAYFYDFSMHTTRTTSTEGLQRAWAEGGPVFQSYEVVRDRFALDGIRIMNATAGGRLEVFPRVTYEDLVGGA